MMPRYSAVGDSDASRGVDMVHVQGFLEPLSQATLQPNSSHSLITHDIYEQEQYLFIPFPKATRFPTHTLPLHVGESVSPVWPPPELFSPTFAYLLTCEPPRILGHLSSCVFLQTWETQNSARAWYEPGYVSLPVPHAEQCMCRCSTGQINYAMMLENIHADLARKYQPEPQSKWPPAHAPAPVGSDRFLRPPPLHLSRDTPSLISGDGLSSLTSPTYTQTSFPLTPRDAPPDFGAPVVVSPGPVAPVRTKRKARSARIEPAAPIGAQQDTERSRKRQRTSDYTVVPQPARSFKSMCFKFSIVEKREERVPDQLRAASQQFEPRSTEPGWLRSCEGVDDSKSGVPPEPLTQCAPQRLADRVDVSPADIGPTDAILADISPVIVEAPPVKRTSMLDIADLLTEDCWEPTSPAIGVGSGICSGI
ncbi:hypothetical protein BDV93DRAFT_517689 [Ceratobasidium sp. AG-I]|nr:hypothetical protein BDV93DRAFT_517689 [Ceratobasidium sp. AG-I]